jgi:hypothetical protein
MPQRADKRHRLPARGPALVLSPAQCKLAKIVAEVRLKSSFIYLANAVRDLTANWKVIALALAAPVLLASLCLLPDALNLQHLVSEAFKTGNQGQNVAFMPAQAPYSTLAHIEPLVPVWLTRTLHVLFLALTAVIIVIVLCTLKWIREGHGEAGALESTLGIYRRSMSRLLPFAWLYVLQLIGAVPMGLWVNWIWSNTMMPLLLAVPVVLLIVPGFLACIWLSVAQYALVFDGYRTWLALFYGRELMRGRLIRVTVRIVVFLAVWSGYNSWAGAAFLALSLLLGLLGAFAGVLWMGVYIADLLSVSVLFATTAFFFAAGLRLYEDLKASASPAAAAMVQGPMSPTGPLQSAAS